jgi:hypothetical protein
MGVSAWALRKYSYLMDENSEHEAVLWEYKWSTGELNEMNRLGREGWEAVGTNATSRALPLGATISTSTSVLFKRRYFPKPAKEYAAVLRLKQLLESERARNGE